jgi:carboxyl-terminal processing protease
MEMNAKRLLPVLALFLAACGPLLGSDATPTPSPRPISAERHLQLFDQIFNLIREGYVYSDYGGVNWESEGTVVQAQIEAGVSDEQLLSLMDGLVAKLPLGTATLITREERIAADLEASAIYEGIGAFVSFRAEPVPRILLLSIIEGSPAQAAGLQAHDAIYAVDGLPVRADENLNVIDRVRGPAGTDVVLTIVSPGQAARDVRVTRGRVTAIDPPRGAIIEPGLIYVLVPVAADDSLAEAIINLLQTAFDQEIELSGIILDLRIAGSGGTWPLVPMLTLLNDGDMGFFVGRDERSLFTLEGQDVAGSQVLPVTILIGPDTSGASEVFVAIMQSSGRAKLVGLPTPGNVLSYQTELLADGSQLTYATSSFATMDGKDLGRFGVQPDVLIDEDWDEVGMTVDPVLSRGIELTLQGY